MAEIIGQFEGAEFVEGFADAKAVSPADLLGKTVKVEVRLSGSDNKTVEVQGTIDFVSPQVEGTKEYRRFRIYADVDNKKVGNQWVIQPGSPASMTIDLGPATTPEGAPKPTRPTPRSTAATTSPLDSIPADTRPRLPVSKGL